MEGSSIQDEMIDSKDFVVYTDDTQLLTTTVEEKVTLKGKEKNVVYKQYDPAAAVVGAGYLAKQFAPEIIAGVQKQGFLGAAMQYLSSPGGQRFVRLVGDRAKDAAGKAFERAVNQTKTGNKTNSTNSGSKGKPPSMNKGMEREPGRNNAAASSFTNLPPLTTVINTPITKRTLSEDLSQTKLGEPNMFVVGSRFALQVSESDDVIYKWFDEVIAPDFQNLASLSVNYGINAEVVFSTNNLIDYINTIAYALQVYYTYASFIAYEGNIPHNKNAGMRWFRNRITQTNMSELEALSRTLRCLPIPPRLNDVCFFLSQPFKNSDCAFASICKFMPFGFDSVSTAHPVNFGTYDSSTSIIQNCVDNLNTPALNTLSTKLANIVPDWLDMTMYAPGPLPVYNVTLCDIWANAASFQQDWSGNTIKFNQQFPCWPGGTGDENTNYWYVSKSDSPDSIAIALGSVFKKGLVSELPSTAIDTGYRDLRPGLLGPEVSYYDVNGSRFRSSNVWTYIKNYDEDPAQWTPMNRAVHYEYCIATDIGRSFFSSNTMESEMQFVVARPAGFDSISYYSLATIRWSAKQLVEWIMDLETMQVKAENAIKKRQPYNSKSKALKTS